MPRKCNKLSGFPCWKLQSTQQINPNVGISCVSSSQFVNWPFHRHSPAVLFIFFFSVFCFLPHPYAQHKACVAHWCGVRMPVSYCEANFDSNHFNWPSLQESSHGHWTMNQVPKQRCLLPEIIHSSNNSTVFTCSGQVLRWRLFVSLECFLLSQTIIA